MCVRVCKFVFDGKGCLSSHCQNHRWPGFKEIIFVTLCILNDRTEFNNTLNLMIEICGKLDISNT